MDDRKKLNDEELSETTGGWSKYTIHYEGPDLKSDLKPTLLFKPSANEPSAPIAWSFDITKPSPMKIDLSSYLNDDEDK